MASRESPHSHTEQQTAVLVDELQVAVVIAVFDSVPTAIYRSGEATGKGNVPGDIIKHLLNLLESDLTWRSSLRIRSRRHSTT